MTAGAPTTAAGTIAGPASVLIVAMVPAGPETTISGPIKCRKC